MDIQGLLMPPQTPLQEYALVFLAGTLTVSSLSDLRRLAAQADFAEVWAAFTVFMFVADVYLGITAQLSILPFAAKWALILAFAVATSARLIAISTMDVAALIALLSVLNPANIVVALVATLIVNELLRPILKSYGEAGAYPFLPTVLAVNLMMLLIVAAGGIDALIRSSS
jgi:hypothetical protein